MLLSLILKSFLIFAFLAFVKFAYAKNQYLKFKNNSININKLFIFIISFKLYFFDKNFSFFIFIQVCNHIKFMSFKIKNQTFLFLLNFSLLKTSCLKQNQNYF